ncbi:ArsR/SmtB family transcription factor [Nonomuraea sp. NPDC049400]|uniref:ArsR/SmtB family transcription factor n=1 Tax=Nonomuraea sp. NPDC049400 TaxID=3364352 RepID=UPI0037BB6443
MHTSLPDFDMPNEEQVHLAAESFRLLSDPTRIKILWALLQGESNVACLAELADAAPTAVSQHLAKLRLAGLVKGRREGTFVYYSAADEHVRGLLAQGLYHADHIDRGPQADYQAGDEAPAKAVRTDPSLKSSAHA